MSFSTIIGWRISEALLGDEVKFASTSVNECAIHQLVE